MIMGLRNYRLGEYGKRVTDGHLLHLAVAKGHTFATSDERIPGAFVIPR
jgi:hypothetical protein